MSENSLSQKLSMLGFKKTELVNYLPISRSTLYVYMNYFDSNNIIDIKDEKIIKLFEFIMSEKARYKNDVIEYMLENFDEESVVKNRGKIFDESNYGDDRNIVLLQKYLKLIRKAANWKDYSYLSVETGIAVERFYKFENNQAKISKTEAIAIFSCLCRESRKKDEDDYLPVTMSLIFDENNSEEEKEIREIGLNYISVVTSSKTKVEKEEFKEDFKKYTGKKIGVGAAIGATAIIVGTLVLKIFKSIK